MSQYNIKGTPTQGLVGATIAYTFGFAAVTLFSPLVSYLDLGASEKGLLLAIVSLTGSLLRIPFASWADANGGKKPMLVLLSVAFLGVLGISFLLKQPVDFVKNNILILLLLGAMAGFGIATFTVSVPQIAFWHKQSQQGKVAGICAGVGGLAPGIFLFIISNVLVRSDGGGIGMVNTYFLWTLILGLAILAYIFIGINAPYFQLLKQGCTAEQAQDIAKNEYEQEIFPQGAIIKSLLVSAKSLNTWGLVCIYFATFGGFLTLTNWFKEFFYDYHGLTLALAALLTSIYSMGASTSRVVGGFLSDKFGGKRLANIFLVCSVAGSLLLATNDILFVNIIGYVVLLITMGVVAACVFKLIPEYVPHAVGGAAGWVGGLGAFGGFIIPILFASMLAENKPEGTQDAGYLYGFYVFAGLMVLSLLVLNLLKKTNSQQEK